jgi:xanthine dehydrogenase molybdenum-binding subunit
VADHKLIGQNYTTPDLLAKVTGQAKYAEDYRAEGMLFCKLLLSPMPHARVVRMDTSAALAIPGVKGILTVDDLPPVAAGAALGENVQATAQGERPLTNEPLYQGEPIVAVAAVDELTAAEAIEKIVIEWEALPFVVDPIESLRPNGPNARSQGNVWARPTPPPRAAGAPPRAAGAAPAGPPPPQIQVLKWSEDDFAKAKDGQLPMGKATDEWKVGDLEAGFKAADVIVDETFVTPNTSHQPLESRTAMAYWQNGKLYLHGSTQSVAQTVPSLARWVGIPADKLVVISEYCGGGFGSKIPGSISMAIPALLSRKVNAPVMMRISREEEHYIGRARPALHARVRLGMRKDGRITALDMFVVCDNGCYDAQGDGGGAGRVASLAYQPMAMRWRGVTVLTNTPPRISQRAPGGAQGMGIMEPIITKAARKLGLDQVAVRLINAPTGKALYGQPAANGKQAYTTSAFAGEALTCGADLFNWKEKKAMYSGQRRGTKARGIGVALSTFNAGSIGFDGLFVIKPDGKMYIHSGIGNLGTQSTHDVHRVAAEMMGMPWEKCEIVWGSTAKNLPWSCSQGGSQTSHAMSRAAHAVATDGRKKLQEIAAKDLGGKPEDYDVANERVFRKGSPGRGMSVAQAAKRAIELGGVYDGHELPKDINAFTKTSATAMVGQGLMGVAKDAYPRDGQTNSFVAGFALVEVDVETGKYHVLEYTAMADCGTVLHPHSLHGQILGGGILGMGHAMSQKWVYDQHYGVPLAKRFYNTKPMTILDVPAKMQAEAVNIPDPETPTGIRGIGEPAVGAGYGAVMNAIIDAVGDEVFRRSPVTPDMILASLEAGRVAHEPLTANI